MDPSDVPDPHARAVHDASRVWQLIAAATLDRYEQRFVVEALGPGTRGQSRMAVRVTPAALAVVQAALGWLPPDGGRRHAVSTIVSAFVELDHALACESPTALRDDAEDGAAQRTDVGH